jgi:hypothetical protein
MLAVMLLLQPMMRSAPSHTLTGSFSLSMVEKAQRQDMQ